MLDLIVRISVGLPLGVAIRPVHGQNRNRTPQEIAAMRECAKKYADDVRPRAFLSRA